MKISFSAGDYTKWGTTSWPAAPVTVALRAGFPTLEVFDSDLIAGLGDAQRTVYPNLRHLRVVTLDHTVDILTTTEPEVEWVS